MLTFNLLLVSLAAAAADHISVEPLPQSNLDIRALTKVEGPVMVVRRTHHTDSYHRCLSAKKVRKYTETQFQYELRSRYGPTPDYDYIKDSVTVHLFRRQSYSGNYEAQYYSSITRLHVQLKLKEKDARNVCFVLWVTNSDGNNGCELLMKVSAFQGIIPLACARYYEQNCRAKSIELHRSDCEYR
uniref:Putative secreted protein n=1 Tax=Amblyomma triste TaxID=251400 RepID=A0A023G995_AMBTT